MKKLIVLLSISAMIGLSVYAVNTNVLVDQSKQEGRVKTENVIGDASSTEIIHNHYDNGSEGFGRCSKSGCYCKAFEGRGQTCRNCGHDYNKHY